MRPPAQSPVPKNYPSIAARRHLRVRHPAYNSSTNIIASFASTDNDGDVYGVQFHLVHTACAVIANNRFDGWLSNSEDATTAKIRLEDNAILPAQDYFFHIVAPVGDTGDDTSSSAELAATPTLQLRAPILTQQLQRPGSYTYPLVPNFRSWSFPHGKIPSSWRNTIPDHTFIVPGSLPPAPAVYQRDVTCRLTNYSKVKELAHVLPVTEKDWFGTNGMSQYSTSETRGGRDVVDSESNLMLLRSDVHTLWDRMRFSVLPKQKDGRWVLAAHVATSSQELHALYHNLELQPIRGIPAEYLFARFVWDVMPQLRGFLQGGQSRRLAVQQPNGETKIAEYTPEECQRLCEDQGVGRSASPSKRKRAAENTGADHAGSGGDETGRKGLGRSWSSSFDSGISGLEESIYWGGNDDGYDEEWDTKEKDPFGGCTEESELEAIEKALWKEQTTDSPRGRKRQRA